MFHWKSIAQPLSFFVAGALYAATAAAAPGDLNTAFGGGTGGVLQPALLQANALALLPDGRLVAAGYGAGTNGFAFGLARFGVDGSADPTFGSHGVVISAVGPGNSLARALVVQPDGRLVAAGYAFNGTDDDIAVVRYNPNGGVDSSFAGGAALAPLSSGSDQAYAVALMADGRIVVAGYTHGPNGNLDLALLRFLPDGLLDPGFGTKGVVTTPVGPGDDVATAVVVQPDGKPVIAGYSANGSDFDFVLARDNGDGTLDTSFSGDGKLTVALGAGQDYATSLLIQPDGKLVAGGASEQSGQYNLALLRVDADGTLDNGFGNGGIAVAPAGGGNAFIQSLARQPTGEIIAAGYAVPSSGTQSVLARFTADGQLDTGFAGSGIVSRSLVNNVNDALNAVVLEPNGVISAAGYAGPTGASAMLLAQFFAVGTPWNLSPSPFQFSRLVNVDQKTPQTSNTVTISGLDSGIAVPFTVTNGEYAQNGATTFTSQPGWARNGDTFKLRHTSMVGTGERQDTVLRVGGMQPVNNPVMLLGITTAGTFESETNYSAGAWDPLSLAALALLAAAARRRG